VQQFKQKANASHYSSSVDPTVLKAALMCLEEDPVKRPAAADLVSLLKSGIQPSEVQAVREAMLKTLKQAFP
jgi:hypothetical protein